MWLGNFNASHKVRAKTSCRRCNDVVISLPFFLPSLQIFTRRRPSELKIAYYSPTVSKNLNTRLKKRLNKFSDFFTYTPLPAITKNLDTCSNLHANVKLQIKLKYNRLNNATYQRFSFRPRTEEISLAHSDCQTNFEFKRSLGEPVI